MTIKEKAQEIVKHHEKFADAGALVTKELTINAINAAIISLEHAVKVGDFIYDNYNTKNTDVLNKLLEQRLILSELRIMLLKMITDDLNLLPYLSNQQNIINQPSTTITSTNDKSN